jgi:hypothetical protein
LLLSSGLASGIGTTEVPAIVGLVNWA